MALAAVCSKVVFLVVYSLLFIVAPIGFGFFVLVDALCCGSWCPLWFINHLAEEERAGCFTLCFGCLFLVVPGVGLQSDCAILWSYLLSASNEVLRTLPQNFDADSTIALCESCSVEKSMQNYQACRVEITSILSHSLFLRAVISSGAFFSTAECIYMYVHSAV